MIKKRARNHQKRRIRKRRRTQILNQIQMIVKTVTILMNQKIVTIVIRNKRNLKRMTSLKIKSKILN